jgi:hypothetical protein
MVKIHRQTDSFERFAEAAPTHGFLVAANTGCPAIDAQALPSRKWKYCCARVGRQRLTLDAQGFAQYARRLAQFRGLAYQQPFHGLPQVGHKMPSIGDLLRARNRALNCIRVGASPVSGDYFDRRMLLKPIGNDR